MAMKMVALFLALVAVASAKEYSAVVHLVPHNSANNVTGKLTLNQQENGPVTISGTVYGLSAGYHGFHVHEKGDFSNGCLSFGAHFNPDGHTHGAPEDSVRHVGDLGNILADNKGVAVISISDTVISLRGSNSILGRGLVVHAGVDDLGKGGQALSLSTGNAGDRAACGVIGVLSPTDRWTSSGGSIFLHSRAIFLPAIAIVLLKFSRFLNVYL